MKPVEPEMAELLAGLPVQVDPSVQKDAVVCVGPVVGAEFGPMRREGDSYVCDVTVRRQVTVITFSGPGEQP